MNEIFLICTKYKLCLLEPIVNRFVVNRSERGVTDKLAGKINGPGHSSGLTPEINSLFRARGGGAS